MSYLEYIALKYSIFAENWGYNVLIIVLAALLFGYFKKVDDRMQRGTYFLNAAIVVFFSAICQALWIFSIEALAGGYLIVLVLLDVIVWVTVGYWFMFITKARSNDAYGHPRYAALGFIPIANLWLLFTPSKDKQTYSNPAYLSGVTAVVIGLVITGVSRGVTTAVERSIQEQIAIAAETDRSLDLTEIYFAFFVLDGGLKAGLEYLASLETLGTAESGETSLERVDVTNNSIIYRNRILDDTVMGTNPEWEANLREHFCKNYDFVLNEGGSIQFDMFTNSSGTLTMVTADPGTCKD